jgi:hypothetical protein
MTPLASLPEPDVELYKPSADIDFIRFFSNTSKSLIFTESTRFESIPMRKGGRDGMLLTIHDPTVYELIVVARELPNAVIEALEVSFDFTPKDAKLSLLKRHELIEEVRQWLISHLLPWQAVGMQPATRVSAAKGHCEQVFNDKVARRAKPHETMYYGHSDSKYADRSKPNFASMRLYTKIKDHGRALPPAKHRCRVEVTLNQFGCKHFNLTTPASIFDFEFRKLGDYFRLVKPEVMRGRVSKRVRARHPRLSKFAEEENMRLAAETLIRVGSHAASRIKLLNVDRLHRHTKGNKIIQKRLDNMTSTYKRHRKVIDFYAKEWGSF